MTVHLGGSVRPAGGPKTLKVCISLRVNDFFGVKGPMRMWDLLIKLLVESPRPILGPRHPQ